MSFGTLCTIWIAGFLFFIFFTAMDAIYKELQKLVKEHEKLCEKMDKIIQCLEEK